jgi:hypothetical protein
MAQLAIFKGEKSIDELAARLFQIKGNDPQASKQAADALMQANPQLASLDRVPAGSVVVVPDTPHPVNTGEIEQPAALLADPARSVAENVNAFGSSLAAVSADAAAQADSTLNLLQDRSLKAAAAIDQVLAQRLVTIEESTKTTLKDLQAKQTMLQQALAQMQQDLARFLKPPAPSPPPPPAAPGNPPPSPPTPSPQVSDRKSLWRFLRSTSDER